MTLKWNIEWVDLKNIEHMIAECWRMNNRQLQHYYRELSGQQELIFAGELGITFLELVRKLIDGSAGYDWSELQKDVHMLQKLIQNGLDQNETYWKERYHELADNPEFYFYTKLGRTFTECLAEKLSLNITEAQKLLLRDIAQIQKICTSVDLENEIKVQKTISFLTQKNKNYFFSWLGKGFVKELQEHFGQSEETVVPQKKSHRLFKKPSKKLFTFFIFISISFMAIFLASQLQGIQNSLKLHQLMSIAKTKTDSKTPDHTKTKTQDAAQQTAGTEADDASLPNTSATAAADAASQIAAGFTADAASQNTADFTVEDIFQKDISSTDVSSKDVSQKNVSQNASDIKAKKQTQTISDTKKTTTIKTEDTVQNTSDTKPKKSSHKPDETFPKILPQYQAFHNTYPDLFGWLKIPGTEIDVPVMQSDDEERGEKYYYLHRDYMGMASEEGSLFVDTKSSCYPQDDNTVIYGHNMNSGHIFGTLDQFEDPDFFRSHQTIQYDTIYETGTYKAAAILKSRILYQEEEGFRYYRFFNYNTNSEFQECLEFIKQHQLFDSGEVLEYGDRLLMLSTCEYSQENGRLVVVAKRLE